MNTIDRIYELIKNDNSINTFNNNQELFQDFYYHNMSIQYNGFKVIEIYKYLLSIHIDEYNEIMPYINSKIFEDFNHYEINLTQNVYMAGFKADDKYVEELFKFIELYSEFSRYEDQSVLDKLIDNNHFVRDYTATMIVILNSSFFKLSNDNIQKMMNLIKNNSYLQKLIEDGKIGKQLLDKDYIFEYCSRFLFNAEFINNENIDNDLLLNSIKEKKFKDKDTIKRIFKKTDINILFNAFDNFSSFVDILEYSLDDEYDRIELFKIVCNKLIECGFYRILLDFIIKDKRNEKYLTEEEIDDIIIGFSNNYPSNISDDEVNFILSNEPNEVFLINLKKDLKKNNWNEETINKVKNITKDIPEYNYNLYDSIDVLNNLFTNNSGVDIYMIFACLECLIKNYLHMEDITVYLINSTSKNGSADTNNKCIRLNSIIIDKMLLESTHDNNPKSLRILETIFHESRHIEQFSSMNENMDKELYVQYKEELLVNICSQYYDKNYYGVSFEKDARIVGAQTVVDFLKNFFPYMKKSIDYYEKKVLYEKNREEDIKKIFELSDDITIEEVMDKLISINPNIIEQYGALKREYNLDGSKKSISDIKIM